MEQPKKLPGSKLCLAITKDGLTAYGNPEAFRSLAKWLEWIAASNPAEHFECHVGMDLESDESKFQNKTPKNVWVLIDKDLSSILAKRGRSYIDGEAVELRGFDVNFMAVPENELDQMARYQDSGVLPDYWGKETKK
jgi:hypothetical protein